MVGGGGELERGQVIIWICLYAAAYDLKLWKD